jgi:hypothetical protein
MNLLQNIVGAINKQMHSILPCSLTTAAAAREMWEVVAGIMTRKYEIMFFKKTKTFCFVLLFQFHYCKILFTLVPQLQQFVSDLILRSV